MTTMNPSLDAVPHGLTALGNLGRRSVFAGADVCETARLALARGAVRPKFEDDVWILEGLVDAPVAMWPREKRWDFTAIHNPAWRVVAKEYLLASLSPHHESVQILPYADRNPRNPRTCHMDLLFVTAWFNWLTTHGVDRLLDVTQDHCDAFLAEESYTKPKPGKPRRRLDARSIRVKVQSVQRPALYGELFSTDRYIPGFIPWAGKSANEVAGVKWTRMNSTPEVPDEVFGPALAAALYILDVLAPHVLTLKRDIDQATADPADWSQRVTLSDLPKLRECLEQARKSGTPLTRLDAHHVNTRLTSGWREDDPMLWVSLRPMTLTFGKQSILKDTWELLRSDIEETLQQVGLEGQWGRTAPAVPRADDQQMVPWTLPITSSEGRSLVSMVVFAAMYVTFALSGMRSTELWEITRGSRRVDVVAGGKRYRLASRIIKHRRFGGIPDEWVVLPEVDRAIDIGEQLTGVPEGHTVFGRRISFYDSYKRFRAWVNGPAGQRFGLTPIPQGQVNPRMLRRKLALCLAQRPGGVLAAKVALKHVSIATTEGYVAVPGGSQAKFMAEVEQEEHDHRIKQTVQVFKDYQEGKLPTGPGARHLIEKFAHVDAELNDQQHKPPKVLDNERRIENLLRDTASTLHFGVANYCWFRDPSQALCLRMAGTPDASKPLAGMCDSARCPQATHHPCHRQVWENHAHNQKVFLDNPRFPKSAKPQIRSEYERSLKIIAQIDASGDASPEQEGAA